MRRLLVCLALMLPPVLGLANTDINQASEIDLDGLRGIGPSLSGKILAERKKAPFRDWQDLQGRVNGIGDKSAQRLSDAGLTVNGAPYQPAQRTTPSAPR